jgi:hypothetical protein
MMSGFLGWDAARGETRGLVQAAFNAGQARILGGLQLIGA